MESRHLTKILKFLQDRDNYESVKLVKEANNYINFKEMSIDSKQPTSLVNEVMANLDHMPNTKIKLGYFNRIVGQRGSYAFGRKCTFNRSADVCEILFSIDTLRKCAWYTAMHGSAWLEIQFGEDGIMKGIETHDAASCFEFTDKDDGVRGFIIIEDVTDEFGMPAEDILSVRVIEDLEGGTGESSGQAAFKINQYVFQNNKLVPTEWMQDVIVAKESFMEDSEFNGLDASARRYVSDIVMRIDNDPFRIGLYRQLKVMVDELDLTLSETIDFVKKSPRNPIKISGYNESMQAIAHNINAFNLIPLASDGDAKVMESVQDVNAVVSLMAILENAVYEQSGAVRSDQGTVSYSGTAIRMKYAQLDIAAQYLQASMLGFFKRARPYMQHLLGDGALEVIFDTDVLINESDTIVNIVNSQELISFRTQLENHPWVLNVDEELKRLSLEGRGAHDGNLDLDADGFVELDELDELSNGGLSGAPNNQANMADASNANLNPSEANSTSNNQKRISGTSSNGTTSSK